MHLISICSHLPVCYLALLFLNQLNCRAHRQCRYMYLYTTAVITNPYHIYGVVVLCSLYIHIIAACLSVLVIYLDIKWRSYCCLLYIYYSHARTRVYIKKYFRPQVQTVLVDGTTQEVSKHIRLPDGTCSCSYTFFVVG